MLDLVLLFIKNNDNIIIEVIYVPSILLILRLKANVNNVILCLM